MSFRTFRDQVYKNFQNAVKHTLWECGNKDTLWATYLSSFPEGTNLIVNSNTEHEDSICRHFVKNANFIWFENNVPKSVWSGTFSYPYDVVAEALNNYLVNQAIIDEKFWTVSLLGAKSSGGWDHFYGEIPSNKIVSKKKFGTLLNERTTSQKLLLRAITEIKLSAVEDVLDLIESKKLYRGDVYGKHLKDLRDLLKNAPSEKLSDYAWKNYKLPIAGIKNQAIGTLLMDLSEGKDLEQAVNLFESIVAPQNYQRSSSLVTKSMIEKALEEIERLGIRDSLDRKLATEADIEFNKVLWVNGNTSRYLKGSLEDILFSSARTKTKAKEGAEISLEQLINDVLPGSKSVELLVEPELTSRFVTLTTAQNMDTPKIFHWDNPISWSYSGNLTDGLRNKVKAKGGKVDTNLRISLSWSNSDDLDLHVTPPRGFTIFYGRKKTNEGRLDLDANFSGIVLDPIENIYIEKDVPGEYQVEVHQYTKRGNSNIGFTLELATRTQSFLINKPNNKGYDFSFKYKDGIISDLPNIVNNFGTKWGIKLGEFATVKMVIPSPNHWDHNKNGLLHYFFLLEGCNCDEPVRGIYNEYLTPALKNHRKVFEVLGDKMMCSPTERQLSGLGFSEAGTSFKIKIDNKIYQVTT